MTTRTVFLSLLCTLLAAGMTHAQTTTAKKEQPVLSLVGVLNCSACDLKKEQGAASQCSIYGHQYSFKAEKVHDASGKRLGNYEDRTYHILRNDPSKGLAHEKHTKKNYNIKGKIYDEEHMLEVVSFTEAK